MSRVGKKPIPVPKEVTVTIRDGEVMVQGPKGSLNRSIPPELEVSVQEDQLTVKTLAETNKIQAPNSV